MRKFLDTLYLWGGYASAFFLFTTFALMMIMALGREVSLNVPAGDDFASWCMAAMSFLGLAHTFKRGEMIRVGLLLEKLTGRAKHIVEIWALAISFAFIAYFARWAVQLAYDSYRFNDLANGVVPVPLWIPQLGFCIGLILLAIAFLDELIHVLRGNKPTFEKPPPKTTEELLERVVEGGGL